MPTYLPTVIDVATTNTMSSLTLHRFTATLTLCICLLCSIDAVVTVDLAPNFAECQKKTVEIVTCDCLGIGVIVMLQCQVQHNWCTVLHLYVTSNNLSSAV